MQYLEALIEKDGRQKLAAAAGRGQRCYGLGGSPTLGFAREEAR
jgi:hypothetical protein